VTATGDLAWLSIRDLVDLLERREVSAEDVTRQQLDRIAALNPRLNAYITVLQERAIRQARDADAHRASGDTRPLLGLPVALKDLFATAGIRTTAGSRLLANNVPDRDATVVRRLEAAGVVLLGKTNMMEFAYGYPHPDYGETRNPWNLNRTAGGSSGGSAAAVSAGIAYGALGSDTGGSIRSPAAYCGICGLKPSYGLVSRAGVVPLAWSLDHAGPLGRTVRDVAYLLDVIAGYDAADPASARSSGSNAVASLDVPVSGMRIGIVESLFERYVQPDVRRVAEAALPALEGQGLTLEAVVLPHVDLVGPAIMPIIQAEATAYHWPDVLARPEAFGRDILANLRQGATVLAKDYIDAQRLRRIIADEVSAALRGFDALVFPTQPIIAPPLDAYTVEGDDGDDVLDVEIGHTGLANLTGHPAVSVPCGLTEDGLPVGIQFTGKILDDGTILRLAQAFETASGWAARQPPIEV
jgi:aspartyl-tRNA(Asn)/glutamyl-tRNA(Gln) amidotransferase subunit A